MTTNLFVYFINNFSFKHHNYQIQYFLQKIVIKYLFEMENWLQID